MSSEEEIENFWKFKIRKFLDLKLNDKLPFDWADYKKLPLKVLDYIDEVLEKRREMQNKILNK